MISHLRSHRLLSILLLIIFALAPARADDGQRPAEPTDPTDTVLHPSALVRLIDEIGGRRVKVVKAKVIAVLNPRAFLVQTEMLLDPLPGNYDRVLVLIDEGALRIEANEILDANVRINGIARTLLGLQTSREVPWPHELTKDVLKRYEIRAAVLARSVQTTDGVELTYRQ
jgi:hypothetical protein